jgi:hypothetical protein
VGAMIRATVKYQRRAKGACAVAPEHLQVTKLNRVLTGWANQLLLSGPGQKRVRCNRYARG